MTIVSPRTGPVFVDPVGVGAVALAFSEATSLAPDPDPPVPQNARNTAETLAYSSERHLLSPPPRHMDRPAAGSLHPA